MNTRRVLVVLLLVLALLLGTGAAVLEADGYSIAWYTAAGGGGHSAAGAFTLDATIGQAVAGQAAAAPSGVCAGFWCWRIGNLHIALVRK